MRHKLAGDFLGEIGRQTSPHVDGGKLFVFFLSILAEPAPSDGEVRCFGISLRTDGDIFAGCHRQSSGG